MAFFRDEGKLRSDDVRWALESFNCGIKEYFDDTFRQFHTDLYQNIVHIRGICCQKCSKKKQVGDWCSLCSKWRDVILAKHRFRNTMMGTFNWKNIDSTKWPSDVEEVQKVFLPSWYKGKLDTTDLSSCLSIMTNCTLFNNRKKVLDIRDIRNHVSHGGMSISVSDKQEYIGKILSFLKKDNLKTFPSVRKAIKHVTLLETQSVKEIYENDLIEEIERNRIEERLNARRGIYNYLNTCATSSILISLLVVLMASMIYQWSRNNVSEDDPWVLGQPSSFFTFHEEFFGRVWVKQKIREKLKQNTSGVILVAGLGYGKSALIADFIRQYDDNANLPMIGYHVCQYDSRSPFGVSNFIFNLYGGLRKRYTNFMKAIPEKWKDNKEMKNICTFDPFQCFQELIVHPLTLTSPTRRSLFVIDAIDECYESALGVKTISVPELLFKQYRVLQPFVTFFMTSRNHSLLLSYFRTYDKIHLFPNDEENIKDLKLFLQSKTRCTERNIDRIVTEASNNFLILRYHLFDIDGKCISTQGKTIRTIYEIYDFEFLRRYGNDFSRTYRIDRLFFEIICSQIFEDSINVSIVRKILHYSSPAPDEDEFEDMMHRLTPNLIRIFDDNVLPLHSSLLEWLESDENVKFKVNIRRGHYLWTQYLYDKLKMKSAQPLKHTDSRSIFQPYALALHLIHAGNESLHDDLTSGKFKIPDIEISCVSCWNYLNKFVPFIYRTISHTEMAIVFFDDYKIIKTLTLMSRTVNWTNEVITALVLNRDNSLRALLENCRFDLKQKELIADSWMTFGRNTETNITADIAMGVNIGEITPNLKALLNVVGNFSVDEVNVFHLFIQEGNFERVRNLLLKDLSILDEKTGNGLDAFDIAISLNNVDIFDLFASYKSMNRKGWYLWYASVQGSTSIVSYLLKQGTVDECRKCSLEQVSENDGIYAAFLKNATNATKLISISQLSEFRRHFACESSLSVAVKRGHDAVVRTLLLFGSKCLEFKDAFGFTPLAAAIYNRHDSTAELLLHFKANVNFVIKSTINPTKIRFFNSYLRFPLEKNWSSQNIYDGATIVHLISLRPTCFSVILMRKILQNNRRKKFPIDLDVKDSNGRSPLYYAICHPDADNFQANLYDTIHPKSHTMVFLLIKASKYSTISDLLSNQLGICTNEMEISVLVVKSRYMEKICKLKSKFPRAKDFTVISEQILRNDFQGSIFHIEAKDDVPTDGTYLKFYRVLKRNPIPNFREMNVVHGQPKDELYIYLKGNKFGQTSHTVLFR